MFPQVMSDDLSSKSKKNGFESGGGSGDPGSLVFEFALEPASKRLQRRDPGVPRGTCYIGGFGRMMPRSAWG